MTVAGSFDSMIVALPHHQGPQFSAYHRISSRAAEFASLRYISMFPRNFAEFGNFRVHSVNLRYHLIDLRIIPINKSSNRTKINRLLRSLSSGLTYGTICSLCKVYLAQSMDFTCANFLFTLWIVYMWNKSHRNS